MENYSDSSINEAGRQSSFAQEYLKSLKTSLEYDSTGMTFNRGKLIQYVDPKLLEKKTISHMLLSNRPMPMYTAMDSSRYTKTVSC